MIIARFGASYVRVLLNAEKESAVPSV